MTLEAAIARLQAEVEARTIRQVVKASRWSGRRGRREMSIETWLNFAEKSR